MVQRDVGIIGLLANNHCMPLTERAAANILTTQTDIKTLSKQEKVYPMNYLSNSKACDPESCFVLRQNLAMFPRLA